MTGPKPAWAADPPAAKTAGRVVLAAAGLAMAALAADWSLHRPKHETSRRPERGLHGAAAGLSASVLLDSAVEHYRGAYENPGMYTPLVVSALGLVVGGEATAAGRLPRAVRAGSYALEAAVGAAGLGFHLFNVLRKPGGLSWQNVFYGAPVGAPAALSLAGLLGLAADRAEHAPPGARVAGAPLGRAVSALTAAGLLGTVGEAGLLHFRGAFQNPFMWLPVTLPPVSALLMGKAATETRRPAARPLTRAWLALTALVGIAGMGFHAFGVSRAMGGWRNWSQNVVDGPPLPAPPAFSALALAAFSALALRERDRD